LFFAATVFMVNKDYQ